MELDRESQLKRLRDMGRGRLLELFGPVAITSSAVLVATGAYVSGPIWYLFGAFLGIVAISSTVTLRNIRNAVIAECSGRRVRGRVTISLPEDSESSTYLAVTHDHGVNWKFGFVPYEWKPPAGVYSAELVFVSNTEWPALVLTEAGVIVPRYKPKRADC